MFEISTLTEHSQPCVYNHTCKLRIKLVLVSLINNIIQKPMLKSLHFTIDYILYN